MPSDSTHYADFGACTKILGFTLYLVPETVHKLVVSIMRPNIHLKILQSLFWGPTPALCVLFIVLACIRGDVRSTFIAMVSRPSLATVIAGSIILSKCPTLLSHIEAPEPAKSNPLRQRTVLELKLESFRVLVLGFRVRVVAAHRSKGTGERCSVVN